MKVTTDACLFGAWVAQEIKAKETEPLRILDIGTGTGVLSLMLAQTTHSSNIVSVEINKSAYLEANENFQRSPWNDRLTLHHTSIQAFKSSHKYDLIVCNPPFFEESQLGNQEDKNQALHNASLSQKELLENVLELLHENGQFYLLYPEREMATFTKLVRDQLYCSRRTIARNKEGDPVFRVMAAFQSEPSPTQKSEIIIRRMDGKYTNEFWEMLSPYYLAYNSPDQ